MDKKALINKIITGICSAVFLAAGITTLVLRHIATEYDRNLLGTILLVCGFVELIIYLMKYSARTPISLFLVVGGIKVALGFIFFFSEYSIETLCFGWGISDIALGACEIHGTSHHIKDHPFKSFELAIGLGNLIFGIILCVRSTQGLTGHIIFLGISMIVYSLILVGELTEDVFKKRRI